MSNSVENWGLCHVISETKFRVEHIATQTQLIYGLRQEARSTGQSKQILSSHTFVSRRISSRFVNNPSALRSSVSNLFRGGRGRVSCRRPCFCTSCRVLKARTRSMQAPLRRVWYMKTDPPRIPVLVDTPVSQAAIATDQHGRNGICGGKYPSFSMPEALRRVSLCCKSLPEWRGHCPLGARKRELPPPLQTSMEPRHLSGPKAAE